MTTRNKESVEVKSQDARQKVVSSDNRKDQSDKNRTYSANNSTNKNKENESDNYRNSSRHMSRQEAGRRGGEATAEKQDREFYEEIGRRGGEHSHGGRHENEEDRRDRSRYDNYGSNSQYTSRQENSHRGEEYRQKGRRNQEDEQWDSSRRDNYRGHPEYMSRQEEGRRGRDYSQGDRRDHEENPWDSSRRDNYRSHSQSMNRQEAGRLGGQATAEKYGREFYEEMGRCGGEHNHRGRYEAEDQWDRSQRDNYRGNSESMSRQGSSRRRGQAGSDKYGTGRYGETDRRTGEYSYENQHEKEDVGYGNAENPRRTNERNGWDQEEDRYTYYKQAQEQDGTSLGGSVLEEIYSSR